MSYDRRGADRPANPNPEEPPPGLIDPALEDGWLCFQAGTERRRFAPIPPAWFDLPDGVLRVMLDIASPVANLTPPLPSAAKPPER